MSFGAHLARIWRRRFLVAAVTLLAGLAAFLATSGHAGTRYTGNATLITLSQNSSPDQVAVLSTGYVATFLQPSFQDVLRGKINLPADVSLNAQTLAGSQIISILATASDPVTAQRAAGAAANEFVQEVNASLQANRDKLILQMQRAVKSDTQHMAGALATPAQIDMQHLINAVNADPTNDLQILQPNAGVTAKAPATKRTIAEALVGGLILGCLLAWALGAASRRLSSPAELKEKARIEPLVVIPAGDGMKRERQLRQLAAIVALLDLPKPAVVAVAAVDRRPGTDEIAESLARYRAEHGARTILVHADGTPAPASGGGLHEVFPVGDLQDAHGVLGVEHLGELVDSLRSRADLVVIRSPAVSESAESYMICAVADRTLLVAGAGSSADSVVAVRDQMERVGVSLIGLAFVEGAGRAHAEPGRNVRAGTGSGPGAPNRPGTTPSPSLAASRNGGASPELSSADPKSGAGRA